MQSKGMKEGRSRKEGIKEGGGMKERKEVSEIHYSFFPWMDGRRRELIEQEREQKNYCIITLKSKHGNVRPSVTKLS